MMHVLYVFRLRTGLFSVFDCLDHPPNRRFIDASDGRHEHLPLQRAEEIRSHRHTERSAWSSSSCHPSTTGVRNFHHQEVGRLSWPPRRRSFSGSTCQGPAQQAGFCDDGLCFLPTKSAMKICRPRAPTVLMFGQGQARDQAGGSRRSEYVSTSPPLKGFEHRLPTTSRRPSTRWHQPTVKTQDRCAQESTAAELAVAITSVQIPIPPTTNVEH